MGKEQSRLSRVVVSSLGQRGGGIVKAEELFIRELGSRINLCGVRLAEARKLGGRLKV